jgi:hypothetical protein
MTTRGSTFFFFPFKKTSRHQKSKNTNNDDKRLTTLDGTSDSTLDPKSFKKIETAVSTAISGVVNRVGINNNLTLNMATIAAAASAAAEEETFLVESSSPSVSATQSASTTQPQPQSPPIQLCKHWLRSKSCLYYNKGLCKFSHPENYEIPKPGETKKQKSQSNNNKQSGQSQSQNNNPNRHRSAGGRLQTRNDARVAQLRCFIATTINNGNGNSNGNDDTTNILEKCNVLDVAGGKGELAFQLLNLNNVQSCYVVDPRPLKLDRFQRRLQKGYYHRSSTIIQTDIIRNQDLIERNVDHLYCFFSNELWVEDKHNKEEDGDDGDNKNQQDNKEEEEPQEEQQSRKIEFDKNIYKSKGWIWPPVGDDNNEHDAYGKNCNSSSKTTKATKKKKKNDDATKTAEAKLLKSNENGKANDAIITTGENETKIVTTTAPNTNSKNNYNDTQHEQQHLQSSIPTYQYALDVVSKCNLIVGMHPDQAVDAIIDAALYKNISFFVVPCCTYSREFPNRRIPLIKTNNTVDNDNDNKKDNENENGNGNRKTQQQKTTTKVVTTYDELLQYLENKSSDIKRHVLPFEGRNVCLYRVVV